MPTAQVGRPLARDEHGASALISLVVAIMVFTVVFTYLAFHATQQDADGDRARTADLESKANSLGGLLLDQPGVGWYPPSACLAQGLDKNQIQADAVSAPETGRFGLGIETCDAEYRPGLANALDYKKLTRLWQARIQADPSNGLVDYEEARQSLGLDEAGLDMHIRSHPILANTRNLLDANSKDGHLRPLYLGDYYDTDGSGPVTRQVQHSSGVTDGVESATAWVTVTNNGTAPAPFQIDFSLPLEEAEVPATRHTPVIEPGNSYTAELRLHKTSDWDWGSDPSNPGSIRLCVMVVDADDNPIPPASQPAGTFRVYSTQGPPGYSQVGGFQPFEVSTPLQPNYNVLSASGDEAQCVTRTNLATGGYFYGQAQVLAGGGWDAPRYNDQFSPTVSTLAGFDVFSSELFDSDPTNDDERNQKSDGHIVLGSSLRNLVVVFKHTGTGDYTGPSNPIVRFQDDVGYEIADVDGVVGQGRIDFGAIDMEAGVERNLLFAHADTIAFDATGASVDAKVHYATYEGDGTQQNFNDWTLRIHDSADVVVDSAVLPSGKKGDRTFNLAEGTYTARLGEDDEPPALLWNLDVINVLDGAASPFTPGASPGEWAPAAPVPVETAFLDALVESFDAGVFHPDYAHPDVGYVDGGDVYPDVKSVLDGELRSLLMDDMGTQNPNDDVPVLTRYNVVVVGSNVDHSSMTSQHVKDTLADWVEAGGLLAVLGSVEQDVQWLQPLFSVGIEGAGGGLYIPDEEHPILTVPNRLDHVTYDGHEIVWSFNTPADADLFTHVITEAQGDFVAVSDPGSLGLGRVVLSSYMPYDLVAGQAVECTPGALTAECEPLRYVQNLLTIAYRDLFVDYGPPLPLDRPHGSLARVASVHHPDLGAQVPVRVYIFVY